MGWNVDLDTTIQIKRASPPKSSPVLATATPDAGADVARCPAQVALWERGGSLKCEDRQR